MVGVHAATGRGIPRPVAAALALSLAAHAAGAWLALGVAPGQRAPQPAHSDVVQVRLVAASAPVPEQASARLDPAAPATVPEPAPQPGPELQPEPLRAAAAASAPARPPTPARRPAATARDAQAAPAAQPPAAPAVVPRAHARAAAPRTPPVPVHQPPPLFPPWARRNGIEGRLILRVHVDRRGRPDQIEVLLSSGQHALDRAARQAVQHWRFAPARHGAEPVDAWVELPVRFAVR